MVHSKFPNRIKKQDQTPILVNDSLEENVFASETIQYEGMIVNQHMVQYKIFACLNFSFKDHL